MAIFSDAPETLRQRANVLNAGALEITSSEDLQAFKKQKLAIILDQQTPANLLQTQVKKFEEYIRSNPESSVRFFLLHWSQDKEVPDGDRFESINIDQISANDFPAIINKILYKARLPLFLRNGYDVEIKPKLANIGGVEYRPIVIRSYNPSEIDTACEYSEYDYIY